MQWFHPLAIPLCNGTFKPSAKRGDVEALDAAPAAAGAATVSRNAQWNRARIAHGISGHLLSTSPKRARAI
jgi:hypothetical protein